MAPHRHTRRIGRPAIIILAIMAILIVDLLILLFYIEFLPYIPSAVVQHDIFYKIAPILTLVVAIQGVVWSFRNYRKIPEHRNQEASDTPPIIQYLKVILAALFFGFGFPLVLSENLAIPTRMFANSPITIRATVQDVTGFRTVTPIGHAEINFLYKQRSTWLRWDWSDPQVHGLKQGDCIELRGRKSVLGIYVDSAARTTCSPSDS